MRKIVILFAAIIVFGCSNTDRNAKEVAAENVAVDKVEEEFDKNSFYEAYLIDNYKEILESNRLRNNYEELSLVVKNELPITIPNDSLIKILVKPINENQAVSSNFDNSGYSYAYELTYWNETDKKEDNYFGIWSIEESFRIIDGDSIPIVKINW